MSNVNEWAVGLTPDQQQEFFHRREQADLWILPWTAEGDVASSTQGVTSIFAKEEIQFQDEIKFLLRKTLASQLPLLQEKPILLEPSALHIRWSPRSTDYIEQGVAIIAREAGSTLSLFLGLSNARIAWLDSHDYQFRLFLQSM